MVAKAFKDSLALYLLLLVLASCAATWLIITKHFAFLLIAVPLTVVVFARIIMASADSIRKVSFMFNAIDCDDYSFNFSENAHGVNASMLNASLNRIRGIMINAKTRAMEREKYYELIMSCVKTGVITINSNGNVFQVNNEALRMFGLQVFTHINQLHNTDEGLVRAMASIKAGERKKVSYRNERGEVHLALSASAITYEGKPLRIIAVNDIHSELDEREVEAWIRLTRVLTHEIMNSLAPITSLSDTLIRISPKGDERLAQGLETINATTKSLASFVESYRKFTRLQTPVCAPFALKPMLERTASLLCPGGVDFRLSVNPPDMLVYADENLVAQVVVNLIKNAVQAVADTPERRIAVSASIEPNESITVRFSNSGSAIPPAVADDIFMPFFTTKPGGSGIGLSIAKQIMHLHGGSIRLTANAEANVEFTLQFA